MAREFRIRCVVASGAPVEAAHEPLTLSDMIFLK
jgi:hypothetical protein